MTRELLLENICPNYYINNCRFIGCAQCNVKLNEWLDEYDKQIRADAIDEFLSDICKMIVQSESNGNYRFYACEIKQSIADLAKQLKAGGNNDAV